MIAFRNIKHSCTSKLSGFSLVEVMVAMALFTMVSALMAPSFIYHLKTNYNSEVKNGAIAASQQRLDILRSQDPSTLPSSGSDTQNIAVGERTFSVKTIYCRNSAWCSASSRNLNLEITHRNKIVYKVETVFSQLR